MLLALRPLQSYSLAATAGAFALTGASAGLLATHILPASAGSFAESGTGDSFTVVEPASSGAYLLTGAAASFAVVEPATAGAFALTGASAGLLATHLPASAGSFAESGTASALAKGGAVSPTPPEPGGMRGGGGRIPGRIRPHQYALLAAKPLLATKRDLVLSADSGAFGIALGCAGLRKTHRLQIAHGAVTMRPASPALTARRTCAVRAIRYEMAPGMIGLRRTTINWVEYDNDFLLAA